MLIKIYRKFVALTAVTFQINSSFGAKKINANLIINKKSRSNIG